MSLSPHSQKLITSWAEDVKDSHTDLQDNDDEEILRAAAGDIDLFKDYTSIQELAKTIQTKIINDNDTNDVSLSIHDRKDSSDTAEIEKELKAKKQDVKAQKTQLSPLVEDSFQQSSDLEYVPQEGKTLESIKSPACKNDDRVSYASHRETADLRERIEHLEEILHQLQTGRERDITHRKNTQIQINQILREMKTFDVSINKINGTLNASLTKFLSQVQTSLEAVSSGSHAKKIHDQIDASYVDLNKNIDKLSHPPSSVKLSHRSDLREKLNKIKMSNK